MSNEKPKQYRSRNLTWSDRLGFALAISIPRTYLRTMESQKAIKELGRTADYLRLQPSNEERKCCDCGGTGKVRIDYTSWGIQGPTHITETRDCHCQKRVREYDNQE